MSRLDTGYDELTLYGDTESEDDLGNIVRVPALQGFKVRGMMQPLGSTEGTGQDINTRYRFMCRDWPAGAWSEAVWDGRRWDVDGEPKRRGGSPMVRHATVYLHAQSAEVI